MAERLARKLAANEPPLKCLEVDEKTALGCEFQPLGGARFAFPYQRVRHTEETADSESLSIFFDTHDVRILGANLSAIHSAIVKHQRVVVRALEARWKSEFKTNEPFVSSILIEERNKTAQTSGPSAREP